MSEMVTSLIQNFASHLLAAVITLYILKCLLQYCNVPCSSRSSTRSKVQLASRRPSKRQEPLQRNKSNRVVKERSPLALDRNSSRSKTCLNRKERQTYILSQEGFLQPVVPENTNVYTTTVNEILREMSELDVTPEAGMIQAESFNANQDNADYLNNSLEETANNNNNSDTTKIEKTEPLADDIYKLATNVEEYSPIDTTRSKKPRTPDTPQGYKEHSPYDQKVFKTPSSKVLKRTKSNYERDDRSDYEKHDDDESYKKNVYKKSEDERDKVQTKHKCTNQTILIDIKKKPCSMESERGISPKPVPMFCPKPSQYRSCESIHGEELVRRFQPKLYRSNSVSEEGSGEYLQDTDSCTEIQKGDWSESSYCLRTDRQERAKRYEQDTFKTVVIDFRPGYFLSCFSKCCKKLFANISKNDCISHECRCNCSGCKLNSKRPRLSSKKRPSRRSSKGRKSNAEESSPDVDKEEESLQKSQDKHENGKIVAYCNVGVSTDEEEKHNQSRKRRSLNRLEIFPSEPVAVDSYDLLSSSSELSETSYRSRRKQKRKRPFEYSTKNLQNVLPSFPKLERKQNICRPEGLSLIGWRKEQPLKDEEIMVSSDVYSIESSETLLPLKNLNLKKKRDRRISFPSMASNDSEENKLSSTRKEDTMNPSNFCDFYNVDVKTTNCDCQVTDSEDKSSIEEEMAKDLVESFHSILSEMAHSTISGNEPIDSFGCKKKYKVKMNPRKKKHGINYTDSSSNQSNPNTYEDKHLRSSNNIMKLSCKSDLQKVDLEAPFSHQTTIKNIVINSSDKEEIQTGETDLEIKYSIQKNLDELASLLPSFSELSSPSQRVCERDCSWKGSVHSVKRTSTPANKHKERHFSSSSDGCKVSKRREEKRASTKSKSKSAENKIDVSSTRLEKSSSKMSQIEYSIKNQFLKLSALNSLQALPKASSHLYLTNEPVRNYSSEGNSSKDIESRSKLPKKCKTKSDLSTSSKAKQSMSSPNIVIDHKNKTCKSTKGKSIRASFSGFDMTNNRASHPEHKTTKHSEEAIPIKHGENYDVMRDSKTVIGLQAHESESNKSQSERKNILEKDAADAPPEISLGSLDTNDLSSYTILDLGLPADTRFPKMTLFPSNMNASWLILQRQGSKNIRKYIPKINTKNADSLSEDIDGGPRSLESRPVEKKTRSKEYFETLRSRKKNEIMEDDTYIFSDSGDSSDSINFSMYKKYQRLLDGKTTGRREGSSSKW